jgi:hypothetical protein
MLSMKLIWSSAPNDNQTGPFSCSSRCSSGCEEEEEDGGDGMEVKASPRLVREIQRSKIVPSPSSVFLIFKSESRFRSG